MATAKDDDNGQKKFTSSADLVGRNPQYGLDIAGMLAKNTTSPENLLCNGVKRSKNGMDPGFARKVF